MKTTKYLIFFLLSIFLYQCSKDAVEQEQTNINIQYKLLVEAGNGGSVSNTGGRYPSGSKINITAIPSEGYKFSGWSNGSNLNPLEITLTSNISLTANFEEIEYITVELYSEGGGYASGSGNYEKGTEFLIEAFPNDQWEFLKWSDESTENPRSIQATQDISLSAIFEPIGEEPIYIAENGITVKAKASAALGDEYEINGINYKVVNREQLIDMISNEQDLSNVVTSKITNMSELFWYTSNYKRLNPVGSISHWDVSNVTNMKYMFMGSEFNQDISAWDVSSVQDMSYVFNDNLFFDQDLSSWDVSNVNQCELFFNYFDKWPDNKKPQFSNCDTGYEVNNSGKYVNPIYLDENGITFKADQDIIPDRFYYLNNYKFWVPSQEKGLNGGIQSMSYIIYGPGELKKHSFYPHYHKIEGQFDYLQPDIEKDGTVRPSNSTTYGSKAGFEFVTSLMTSLEGLFRDDYGGLQKDLSSWDVSNIENMDRLFEGIILYPSGINIGYWDTSNVSSMKYMFSDTSFLGFNFIPEKSIGSWDVSNVTDMTGMFYKSDFNEDISNWDVSNVKDMRFMFNISEFNQDISNWNISSLEFVHAMFGSSEFNQDMSAWDTSNIKDMSYMFANSKFNQDISNWNIARVETTVYMFYNAKDFNQDIGNWDVSNVTDMTGMFLKAGNFNGDISAWDVSSVTNMSNMFWSAKDFNQDIGSWDVSSVTNMSNMFLNAGNFNQDIGSWDVSNVTDMSYMFKYQVEDDSIEMTFNQDIGSWNTSSVQNMISMFSNNRSFNQDIGSWDVSNVTSMAGMFYNTIFNQDIGSWDVSNVTNMAGMFSRAENFNGDISAWDVSSVTDMKGMFNRAENFNKNLSDWNVENVTKCSYFSKEASNWSLPKPNFSNCSPD